MFIEDLLEVCILKPYFLSFITFTLVDIKNNLSVWLKPNVALIFKPVDADWTTVHFVDLFPPSFKM